MEENKPNFDLVPDGLLNGVARFGRPGIVTQWDEKGRVTRRIQCLRIGQFAIHENMLFVLEGERVRGVIRLGDLQELRVEMRRSFRHPVLGVLISVALIATPASAFLGDPFHIGGFFVGGIGCMMVPFFLFLGGYTLYEVIRIRMIPWLIARNGVTTCTHALDQPLSEEESALLAALNPKT
jgi:hypothetical protein